MIPLASMIYDKSTHFHSKSKFVGGVCMKSNLFVEYKGKQVSSKELLDKVKEVWKEQGGKVKDLKNIDLYCKPEEGMCYYVIDEKETGKFPM